MLQDERTKAEQLVGLLGIDGYMQQELANNPPPAIKQAPQQAPMSLMDQMDERKGKFKNRLGLFGHIMSGGKESTYGDADLLAQQNQMLAQKAMQDKMGMAQPFIDMLQDGNQETNMMGMYGLSQMGFDKDMMEMAIPGMAPNDDTDIMRTTNAYVDSFNAKNKDKPGFKPMTFDEGYDIVKNYDAGRRAQQATATGMAESDVGQYNTSRDAYINAVEQDAILGDRISNIDKGLEMLESGAVDTGPVVGFLAETFGMGSEQLGALQQMGLEEAMDALQAFKGPTTDFEFTKAELKSFAQIFRGENLNIGTLKQARQSIEKVRKRNMLSGQSHLQAAGEYGTKDQRDRLTSVFAQPEYWAGANQQQVEEAGAYSGPTDFSGGSWEEFDALEGKVPPGTIITDPDGKKWRTP